MLITRVLKPSPISNLARWLMAAVTNIVHFADGAHRVAATPLPSSAKEAIPRGTMEVWGQIFELCRCLAVCAIDQLCEAFIAHPVITTVEGIAFTWLCIESAVLLRTAWRWIKA